MAEFSVGDVVRGRFAARPEREETAIVRGRVVGEWYGDCIEYAQGFGYGTWGHDHEVEQVLRRATEDDELRAREVKFRVQRDTERYIAGLRAASGAGSEKPT